MTAAKRGKWYTLRFAAVVCAVCSVAVAGSAVLLRPRQVENRELDRQTRVLEVAGLIDAAQSPDREKVQRLFRDNVRVVAIELATGAEAPEIDPATYDPRRAASDPETSRKAPENEARVARVPHHVLVYSVEQAGRVERRILPMEGLGLWSTLRGYLALSADGTTVRAITFYEHAETPGLGDGIDDPRWQARWDGRKILDEAGEVRLRVIKGRAGEAAADPFRVDGLSGATLTANGVTNMLEFWLGPQGYGPYLARLRRGARP